MAERKRSSKPTRTARAPRRAQTIPRETLIADEDLHYFNEGTHYRLYEKLGAHTLTVGKQRGTTFAVWAPSAAQVSVMGSFNDWNTSSHPLQLRGGSGIWERFIPEVGEGAVYKYHIVSQYDNYRVDKADPFSFTHQVPPDTASIVSDLWYVWGDQEWMKNRPRRKPLETPMSIYEMHLGSWRRVPEEGNRHLSYRELAPVLTEYVQRMGFTHVEFLPVMEHPFYGSWGYQVTSYFAPTRRYGTPQDFMYLIDYLHQHDIGVILDWVPSHYPTDESGLGFFDGTHLYEHADPRQGIQKDWNTFVFNYGRKEVQSFLISNAFFWLDVYHIDGLRVDAVASMLYLDYSRAEGEWVANEHGGRENLEAMGFLQHCNSVLGQHFPEVPTIAEESTSWPMVSRPTYLGGLGFYMKWDMGWMHDMLEYMHEDPINRKYHHNKVTFRMVYAFSENFVLPLSHDEVVYGKGSLIGKMPGDNWQKFANLRLLFGYMYGQPGKKMLFMGGEIAQWNEWNHDTSLDWHLLDYSAHAGVQRWLADLNRLYRQTPALYEQDCYEAGFRWVDCNDAETSVVSFLRYGFSSPQIALVVCNFTPVPRQNYRLGVPRGGMWREALNSDARDYDGSGYGNQGGVEAAPVPHHNLPYSLTITLPPLGVVFFLGGAE